MVRPGQSKYIVGFGDSWKRDQGRTTAVLAALYRAKKNGCACIPDIVPMEKAEFKKMMSFPSVVSQVAKLSRTDGEMIGTMLHGNKKHGPCFSIMAILATVV